MGGEFLILLLLIGAGIGLVAAFLAVRRYRGEGSRTALAAGVSFLIGLLTPIALFFGVGTLLRMSNPPPHVPVSSPNPGPASNARVVRPNLSLNPDASPAALRAVRSAPVSLVR